MDGLSKLLLRTLIIYFLLTTAMRIMGKRQLGDLQVSELVTTLLLSEIAAVPITDFRIPITRALIPVIIIISLEIIIPFFAEKNRFMKKLIEGTPTYIIYQGKLQTDEIKKNRLSLDELICEMRSQGYFDISDIRYAILEPNGRLSILPNSTDETKRNIGGMVHHLILNGEIIEFNLKRLDLNKKWLYRKLKELSVQPQDLNLFGVDDLMNIVSVVKSETEASKIEKIKKNPPES